MFPSAEDKHMFRNIIVGISILADLLDFTGVGHFLYFIDVVVIILHMLYAGPKALIGILDMLPGIGVLPIYTALSLTYEPKS